ncbi:MAG: bifunctional 4'-phosphopantothenoylcysteine decarboxylase/phosphopantothenoylcysteine synthetase, partial [Thiothrix lacustris]
MSFLSGKNILLGISGGIAAYKSAELLRLLVKQGANVRVCMTASAQEFITPLTMQALSGNPVHTTLLDPQAELGMGHIELARWAEVILIAPATANTLARLTWGIADDLLSTVCLASTARLIIAPAMNQQMWKNVATQHNVHTLKERGVTVLGPAEGVQACGDTGFGRMLEPADIVR